MAMTHAFSHATLFSSLQTWDYITGQCADSTISNLGGVASRSPSGGQGARPVANSKNSIPAGAKTLSVRHGGCISLHDRYI